MKIADIRATLVAVPLEAPLQHASGAHWGRFVDIIDGGMFEYESGSIKVPDGPGLGVSLDRDKLDEYAELYKEALQRSSTKSLEDILTTGTPDTRTVTPSCPSSASQTHTRP